MELLSKTKGYEPFEWNCGDGLLHLETRQIEDNTLKKPEEAVTHILEESKAIQIRKTTVRDKRILGINAIVYIMLDALRMDNPLLERQLKNLVNVSSIVTVFITGPKLENPSLKYIMPVITAPDPTSIEYGIKIDNFVEGISNLAGHPFIDEWMKELIEQKEKVVDILKDLTLYQAKSVLSYSIISKGKFSLKNIQENKRIFRL